MTEKTINCAECNVEFTFEENPKFPRKYCLNCSAKKKAEYEAGPTVDTPVVGKPEVVKVIDSISAAQVHMKKKPKTNNYKLKEENIRIGAANAVIAMGVTTQNPEFWSMVKEFEEYIRNGK